jgi:hypothetical protein
MVKGIFCALTGRAAFLFRGNVGDSHMFMPFSHSYQLL